MSGDSTKHDKAYLNAKMDEFYRETGVWPPGREIPKARRGTSAGLRMQFWQFWLIEKEKVRVRDEQLERIRKQGLKVGIIRFAHRKDGVQYVGMDGKTLDDALAEVDAT